MSNNIGGGEEGGGGGVPAKHVLNMLQGFLDVSYVRKLMSIVYRLSMFKPEDLNVQLLRIDHSQLLQDANWFAQDINILEC